jgi:hypothetical protein
MYKPVFNGVYDCTECDQKDCRLIAKKEEYCPVVMGHLTVEHNPGNTWSYCSYSDKEYDPRTGKKNNLMGIYHLHVYEYTGKKAIQNVLEFMQKFPVETLIEMIIKYRFYNRSYMDYFDYYQEVNA